MFAYYQRAKAHLTGHDYDRAISDFNTAIELEPNVAGGYSNRGTAYANSKDRGRALVDFRKALALDPNDTHARDGLKRLGLSY